jgi:hypothetical protein
MGVLCEVMFWIFVKTVNINIQGWLKDRSKELKTTNALRK